MYPSSVIVILAGLAALLGSEAATIAQQRIVNGVDTEITSHPYQASLRSPLVGHFCGGTIITPYHILTAAHCLYKRLGSFNVHTGTSYRLQQGNSFRVAKYKIHPDFKMDFRVSVPNDIAIVQLAAPIAFGESQRAAKLPTREVEDGAKANVTGWGQISMTSSAKKLQKLQARVHTAESCQPHQHIPVLDSQICTIVEKGSGMCLGDSGGPLVCDGVITGIVSYSEAEYCGAGYPDVYTKVYHYLDFIKSVVENGKLVGIASWMDMGECANGNPDVYTNVYAYLDWIDDFVNRDE